MMIGNSWDTQQKHRYPVFLHSIIALLFAISNGKIKNIVRIAKSGGSRI